MSGGSSGPTGGPDDDSGANGTTGNAAVDTAPRGERSRGIDEETGDEATDRVTIGEDGVVNWFLNSEDGTVRFVRDVLSSVAIVAVIGLILFGVSGVWPPLVAVESGSMEPNMERGDLVFAVADDRFVGDDPAGDTGVVTLEEGRENDHEKFGNPGDVIVFQPNGDQRETPIIHRAHFWVEKDEEWVDTKADEEIVGDLTCEDVDDTVCPAPHDGFVTKGDANDNYDQLSRSRTNGLRTNVVKPEWVTGKAMIRVPWLGHVRLTFDRILGGMVGPTPTGPAIESATSPGSPDAPATHTTAVESVGLAGATGLAVVGGSAVTGIGRRLN